MHVALQKHFSTFFIAISICCLSACGGGSANGGSNGVTATVVVDPNQSLPQLSKNPTLLNSNLRLGTFSWSDGSTGIGGAGAPINNVNCLIAENYHIHAHLTIFKNGEILAIPAQIGLQGCAYELHTHDRSGIIHIETAATKSFNLGQFFAVWGQPLSPLNVAGITGLPVTVYINDGNSVVLYKGDLDQIEFANHRSIIIQIGSALTELPSFVWDPAYN